MGDCLDQLEKFAGTCLIVRGVNQTFCSGADLSVARENLLNSEEGQEMCAYMQYYLRKMQNLPGKLQFFQVEKTGVLF